MISFANTIIVEFRIVVFRPFKGEIILGRISNASEFGMKSTFRDPFAQQHEP